MKPPVVALLTDFGHADAYVGVMKGVLLSVCPEARVVDLSHEVAPQDVAGAAFLLEGACGYFPDRTIFVCVVDPGVGSERRIVAVETRRHVFLAPDNGLLGFLADEAKRIVRVENRACFLNPVSRTFHGRDIFAPVAGRLAKGLDPARLGPRTASLRTLDLPEPKAVAGGLEGRVLAIDRFGNLITNIRAGRLAAAEIRIGRARIAGVKGTYADAAPGELLAVVGSTGRLEISVNRGHAAERLGVRVGDRVRVQRRKGRALA